jgi:hypothetical protein
MALKPLAKPAPTLDEELGILSNEEEEAAQEGLSKTVTVNNVCGRTVFLENGRLDPDCQGIATRAEYQNLSGYIELVD